MHNTLSPKPAYTIFFNSLLFAPPFLFLIARGGTGLFSLVYLLAAIVFWRAWRAPMAPHWNEVKPLLLAFSLPLLLALAAYALDPEVRLRDLERPIRSLAAASALVVVVAWRPARRFLWWGLIAGAVAGAVFISYQRWGLDMDRPGGLINSITFGDISLCMGFMCLAASVDFRGRAALWPALGALAGMFGSIVTGTRGGWIAALMAVILLLRYGNVLVSRWRKGAALLALALLVASFLVPQSGARERAMQAIADVEQYQNGGNTYTNVGVRLELWRGATLLIAEHPWFGESVVGVERSKQALVARGELPAYVLEFDHFHNDALHATVFGGVFGLLAWAATLVLPFLFFRRQLQRGRAQRRDVTAPALAGMLLVVCYAGFGMTEVIFWTIHSSIFYALMVFMLAGLCLNARQASATPP